MTRPSLQTLAKTQTEVFPIFVFLVNPLKENCHNSRTRDDLAMKPGPVTKIDKRNKTTSKKLTITSCRKILTSLSFSWFLANLVQSGGQIPDTESAKFMFSLTVTFCLAKTENKTKKSNIALTLLLWVKVLFWIKIANFCKKMLTSAKLRGPRYYKVYFLKLSIGVYLRAKSEVSSIILTSFRLNEPLKRTLKSPPRSGLNNSLMPSM